MNFVLSPIDAANRFLQSLRKPARLLVAISGGSDSAGLLIALKQAQAAVGDGVDLVAATIDHRLRRESADEAIRVGALAAELGIAHVIRAWEDEKPASGVSAAAREARYRLLVEIAREAGADAIVTGHTLDDQRETVAMRSSRSRTDGSLGLAGMAEAVLLDGRVWLFRPFLSSRRADIRNYLSGAGYGWIDDPSNLDPAYERVRARLMLAAEGETAAGDWHAIADRRQALSHAAAKLLAEHVTVHQQVIAAVAPAALSGPPDVIGHALSALIAVLGGRAHGPGADRMARVMDFVTTGSPGRMTAGRVLIDRRRDGLYLMRENRDILPLRLKPGAAGVFDGRFRVELAEGDGPAVVCAGTHADERALADFAGLPSGIARAAARIRPEIRNLDAGAGVAGDARITPVFAPYDRFLPEFDLELATRMRQLFGCMSYSLPPRQPR